MYIPRLLESSVSESLGENPVTVITGPRQCGKSTLARELIKRVPGSIYLDLQKPGDLAKLADPQYFFEVNHGHLVCLDEIQRRPELFPVIRSLVDEWGGNGHFLLLGSASRDLLRQSSESLAGRISYKELTPFLVAELPAPASLESRMLRGGFPRSLLNRTDGTSFAWRQDFISTFLERDLLQWSGFSPGTMRRLWGMLAHLNGQLANFSGLVGSLEVSPPTIRRYVDLLADTYMVCPLLPYLPNLGKRLVRSPKLYLSDTGIVAALLEILNVNQLFGHPAYGTFWETLVFSELRGHFPHLNYSFYRTAQGAELDFILMFAGRLIAVECKATLSPALTRGNHQAISDVQPSLTLIVSPVSSGWPLAGEIGVVNLEGLIEKLNLEFNGPPGPSV